MRKITHGSFPSLLFFSIDHINFVTVVVNIQTLVDYRCLSMGILIPINPLIPPFLVSRKFSLQKFPLIHSSNKRGIPQCHRFRYVEHSFRSTPRWPIAKPYKQLTTTISSYYTHRTRKEEKEEDTEEKKEEKYCISARRQQRN